MKSNTHKIADAMACVSREVINQTINLKKELADSMKNETEYEEPCPSTQNFRTYIIYKRYTVVIPVLSH